MKNNRDYEKLLSSGNKAQLEKLKQNEHKRGFENIDFHYAEKRLYEEARELFLELNGRIDGKISIEKVRNEAADIANFAHMIIYRCDQEIKLTKDGSL